MRVTKGTGVIVCTIVDRAQVLAGCKPRDAGFMVSSVRSYCLGLTPVIGFMRK
jgi:hypothetical protein